MADRKYRHRGYQDGGSRNEPSRPAVSQGPRERPEGPRGRGLGAPTATVIRCRVCGQSRVPGQPVEPDTVCEKCGSDLHTCSHCAHFDTARLHQCRKPLEQPVANKSKANLCHLFAVVRVQEFAGEQPARSGGSTAKDAFDALFRKR